MSRTTNSDSSWFVLVGGFVAALLLVAGIPAFLSYLGVEPGSGGPIVVEQQDDFDPFSTTLDNPLAPILYPGLYPDW